jgi:chromosome segregation ATPase
VEIPSSNPTGTPVPLVNTPKVVPDAQEARELPLDSEAFDVRVHRRVAEYNQRHEQRQRHMSSYDKVTVRDPGLVRFADPRKVQVELSDELDRERTSEELSADYAEQAHDVQSKAQALQDFVARRRQTLDELNKHQGSSRRQDLETAMANLARQPSSPETLAAMREIDRRLSETDREEKDLPAQLSQAQQETADAAEELAKLQYLQQAYEKEAKTFTADALSARQNRLRLANKLEYFVVRAQAEDTLEQGRKSLEAVEHLSPSSEVEDQLRAPGSTTKSDASLEQLRECIKKSGDVRACRQATHQE